MDERADNGDHAGPDLGDVVAVRDLLDLMDGFTDNDQRARFLLSSNWMRDRGAAAAALLPQSAGHGDHQAVFVCPRGCRPAVWDFTTKHFHATERPSVVVFQTPEHRSGNITFHEAWGVDDGRSTSHAKTAEEAVSIARRVYGVTVEVPDATA